VREGSFRITSELSRAEGVGLERIVMSQNLEQAMSDCEVSWDWRGAIEDACRDGNNQWMAQKFLAKITAHKARYPAFKEGRAVEVFLRASPKYRAALCYRPIKEITKGIHRHAGLVSQAANERD
jgi:hypothetical protein